MRILFDNCTPAPLRRYLDPHSVDTAAELDWEELANSALLDAADEHRYDVVVTSNAATGCRAVPLGSGPRHHHHHVSPLPLLA